MPTIETDHGVPLAHSGSSTGVCPFCHHYASPAVRLIAETRNDTALTSRLDIAFVMMLVGLVLTAFIVFRSMP